MAIADTSIQAPAPAAGRSAFAPKMPSVTTGAFGALADQVVVSATSFVTGLLVARACTKDEFGYYSLALTFVSVFLGIQQSLILSPYTLIQHRLRGRGEQVYAGSTLVHEFLFSTGAVLGLMVGAGILYHSGRSRGFATAICGLLAAITFILLRDYDRRISFAKLHFRHALAVDVFIAVAQTAALLILSRSGYLSPTAAFVVMGAACAIAAAGWHVKHTRYFAWPSHHVLTDLKRNWEAGKWVFASYLAVLGGSQLYPWILAKTHGVSATGTFAAAWTAAAVLQTFVIGAGNFSSPLMARAYARGVRDLHATVLAIFAFLTVPAVLFTVTVMVSGERLLAFIYGSKYAGNGTLLFVLAFAVSATAIGAAPSCGLWAVGRENVNFKINMIALLSAVTLGPLLTASYGVMGVASCLLGTNVLVCMIKWVAYAGIMSRLNRGNG